MNRIDNMFAKCRAEGRKALIMFVSAGDPSLAFTRRLVPALVEAGADLIELGVPFSDPMADGPTIQAASERALAGGANLEGILEMAEGLRRDCPETPMVLFSYYNVVLQYGVERLAAASARLGIDGWLLVDVPPEEEGEVVPILEQHGLVKISLLAPTTPPERMAEILRRAKGFVYYITVAGVTGARLELPEDLAEHLAAVRERSPVPVAAGFGVSSPEQARMVGGQADGVIVGSRLINVIQEAADEEGALQKARELVRSLAAALAE